MKRKPIVVLGVLVVLAAGGFVAARHFARAAIYHPAKGGAAPCPAGAEDLAFASADGTKLHGWLARSEGSTRAVLFLHGDGGSVEERGPFLLELARATRAHVLLFDYRGYGRSEGSPSEEGLYADATAALAALEKATGVPHGRTIAFGHSLGGAVAIDLAARTSDLGGLVVLSSFTTLDDMVRLRTSAPVGLLVGEKWDSLGKVPSVKCPKLFIHGDQDPVIPMGMGYALFTAATDPKHFVSIQGGGHDPSASALAEIGRFAARSAP